MTYPNPAAGGGDVRLEITPSGAAYKRGLLYRLAVLGPLIVVGFFGGSRSDLSPAVIWSIVGAGAVVAIIAVGMMVTRVTVTGTHLVARRLVGIQKVIPLGALGTTVFVHRYEQYGNNIAPMLFLTSPQGRAALKLSGQLYEGRDLDALAGVLGNAEQIPQPITPKMLAQRFPRLVPFIERRPFLSATIIVLVVVIIAVVIGVIATS